MSHAATGAGNRADRRSRSDRPWALVESRHQHRVLTSVLPAEPTPPARLSPRIALLVVVLLLALVCVSVGLLRSAGFSWPVTAASCGILALDSLVICAALVVRSRAG
ncbi:MAG TPA: hypothetical protein VHO01_15480 [Jatrophihabitans sp.]|nr:hypothetical protein [Jatrophihabitans sp.]